MPRRPIAPETLQLIDAVRDALAEHAPGAEIEEKTMFGTHVFMVDGKMCLGVENDELLVRLPPDTHNAVSETPGVRPMSTKGLMLGYFMVEPAAYATREAWQRWVGDAIAFNPLAKAAPKKKKKTATAKTDDASATNNKPAGRKRHSVFESDL